MGNHTATRARGRSVGGGTGRSSGSSGKPKAKGEPKAKAPKESIHERSARLQREQGLAAEVKPGDEKAIGNDPHYRSDPFRVAPPDTIKAVYGEHQYGAFLHNYTTEALREEARNQGIEHPGRTKADVVSALTAKGTEGRYSADFATHAGGAKAEARPASVGPTPRERAAESRAKTAESRATAAERRVAQLERQLATLQAQHDALKARMAGERASGRGAGKASGGWSDKNAAAARGAEPHPIAGPSLDAISPYGRTDAYQLRDWYGADQLRAVLVRLSAPGLREAVDSTQARNPGTKPSSRTSKDAMVNYLMEHVAPGY